MISSNLTGKLLSRFYLFKKELALSTTLKEKADVEILLVTKEEEGVRIDKLLADRFEGYSRTYFQYLIENGCVLLNGNRVKKRVEPREGDEIEIFFQITPEISLEAQNIPLNILFEDDDIIVANKPAGMVVHPALGNWSQTFVNALLGHCHQLAPTDDPLRPGIVHRLDKNTSGVLIASKTSRAHQRLIALFCNRKIEKQYLAVCAGSPKENTLTVSMGRHPIRRKEMGVLDIGGKESVTHFQVLAAKERLSLVLAKPITGRTHQIRVHLKYLNAPILGDEVYGIPSINRHYHVQRQLLHAYRIKIRHPITLTPLEFVAPIPDDIKKMIAQFSSPVDV